jgi:hypothetical protein
LQTIRLMSHLGFLGEPRVITQVLNLMSRTQRSPKTGGQEWTESDDGFLCSGCS